MWWTDGHGRIELNITKSQARSGAHQGQCIDDIRALLKKPTIRRQIAKLNPALVATCLKEYGAWDTEELQDWSANQERLLWVACCDIAEQIRRN